MNKYYTIGQLAKLAGRSAKTLRVYERKGLLMPERNGENDYRIYGEEAVKILGEIRLMIDRIPEEYREKTRFASFPENTLVASPETFGWAVVNTSRSESSQTIR